MNNAGSGMDLASVIDAANYQLITVHHPRVGKYVVNVISDVPGTTAGTQTVTLSINGGQYIKGGWYYFTIFSASPSDAQRGAGHRRQRAGRRVLRLLPLGEQHPRRELRRPAHRDPPHHLRPLDDHRPGDPGPSPGHEAGERLRAGDGQPEQAAPLQLIRVRRSRAAQKAADKADHHSHRPSRPRRGEGPRRRKGRASLGPGLDAPDPAGRQPTAATSTRPRRAARPRPWVPSAPSTRRWTSSAGPSTASRDGRARIPGASRPRARFVNPIPRSGRHLWPRSPRGVRVWDGPLSAVSAESRPVPDP